MRIAALLAIFCAALAAGETRLGKPLTLPGPVAVDTVLASPAHYVGKTVQVKGKITAVCRKMGCWTEIAGESRRSLRVKVNDGDMVFPAASIGKTVVAEGTLRKLELTREQAVARARHEAEEQGRAFDPASVQTGLTLYQIEGSGAVIAQ